MLSTSGNIQNIIGFIYYIKYKYLYMKDTGLSGRSKSGLLYRAIILTNYSYYFSSITKVHINESVESFRLVSPLGLLKVKWFPSWECMLTSFVQLPFLKIRVAPSCPMLSWILKQEIRLITGKRINLWSKITIISGWKQLTFYWKYCTDMRR